MKTELAVTIAIPVYNVENYVRKSLLSALDQDFNLPYEVLVIDDCGQDKSMDIVAEVMSSHPNGNIVRVVRHEKNKGLGPARNTSIEHALGQYLLFLDSDDWISHDCLSVLYHKASTTDSDVTVGSVMRVEEGTMRTLGTNRYPDLTIEKPSAGVYMVNHAPDMYIEVWNKLYRMDFLRSCGACCVHRIFEDYNFDFIVRASAKKISFCSSITLFYNIRSNSILTSLRSKGSDEAAQTLCDIIKRLQFLLKERFAKVEGIYDLYYQRVIWVFENFARYDFSAEQQAYIAEHIVGFNSFVIDKSVLKHPRNRYISTQCGDVETIEAFTKANHRSLSFLNKVIFKVHKLWS